MVFHDNFLSSIVEHLRVLFSAFEFGLYIFNHKNKDKPKHESPKLYSVIY